MWLANGDSKSLQQQQYEGMLGGSATGS